MKYGEIKWKVEKVIFQIDGGVITRKSEVDEGRTLIRKACSEPDLPVSVKPLWERRKSAWRCKNNSLALRPGYIFPPPVLQWWNMSVSIYRSIIRC